MSQPPTRRESLHLPNPLSLAHGSQFQPTDQTSTASHPLLSPPPGNAPVQKYLPYVPRHRSPSTFTSTVNSSASTPSHQADGTTTATTSLQLMNLKAAAQSLGVDSSSVGWALLECLVASDGDGDWDVVWSALTSGQATLLLPLEQVHANEHIDAEIFKDHIIFTDGSSRQVVPVVTSSGLRGVITKSTGSLDVSNSTLTLRTALPPSSKLFQAILSPATRASAFSSLPPLPLTHPSCAFPSYNIPSHTLALPLPPRPSFKPSKPTERLAPSAASTATSRLPISFASLFGKSGASSSTTPASISTTPSSRPPTPPMAGGSENAEHAVEIHAFTISSRIARAEVTPVLAETPLQAVPILFPSMPKWVAERIAEFVKDVPLGPFICSPRAVRGKSEWKINDSALDGDGLEELAERVQTFYAELELEVQRRVHEEKLGEAKQHPGTSPVEKNDVEHENEDDHGVHQILETVESAICALFYDRLFCQPGTDDASHDEALSSRVAALHMLDLGLEHLDVDVGDAGPELDLVVRACGETLTQLDACLTPAEKSHVLVAAHRVVVDGLSQLPPIRLKSNQGENKNGRSSLPNNENELKPLPPIIPSHGVETAPVPYDASRAAAAGFFLPATDSPSRSPLLTTESLSSPIDAAQANETETPTTSPTVVSGDILLPIVIFSVVKANPPHLVSHLLFTQRFRNRSLGGEESYCLINLMAVAEFLENIDLAALGLADGGRVISPGDLSPLPIHGTTFRTPLHVASSLRGRIDDLAGSANKVISGVVDSSFGVFRSLLPGASDAPPARDAGFGLLRRDASSGFSIASLAASLPVPGVRARPPTSEEAGQQLVEVAVASRPPSVKDDESDGEESMEKKERARGARKSLSDRLASMSGLKGAPSALKHPLSRPTLFHISGQETPSSVRLAPPVARFLECAEDDIRVSEVGELLREYRRLAEGIRTMGGFDE